jgi:hypothetical protein
MRRLFYVSGSVVLGDRTCKALLRYARALSKRELSDVVSLPFVGDSGEKQYSHFLIGPASQLYSTPVDGRPDVEEDETDKKVLMDLERKTKQLQPDRPMWSNEMQDVSGLDDYSDVPDVTDR